MTAQPPASAFRSSENIEGFCTLRSRFIDEFARLELAVSQSLVKLRRKFDARKTSFGQRITELSNAKPGPTLSKANASCLRSLALDCEPLQRLRASVVHSAMELGFRNGEPVAFFRNVADIIGSDPICHAMTRSDFQESILSVRRMTDRVEDSFKHPLPTAKTG